MNREKLAEEQITVREELHNTAYLLGNSRQFLNSDYRIMKNQEQAGLAKCIRMLHNGSLKLVFFTGDLRSLSSLYGCMNFTAYTQVLENLFSAILSVQQNGFLRSENLNESFEYIFVDPATFAVRLHYLPVRFENSVQDPKHLELRKNLVRQIHSVPLYSGNDVRQVCAVLEEEQLSLQDLRIQLQTIRRTAPGSPRVFEETTRLDGTKPLAANLHLVSRDEVRYPSFHIHEAEFVLGKSRERADGVVAKSTVSRRHCRLIWDNENYYVEDLDSTNGTRLNQERIPSRQKIRLEKGDVLSVSGVEFVVTF